MSEDNEKNEENQTKNNKKRLTMADHSLAASVKSTKCEKCGQYYYKDEPHYCH